MRARLAMCLHYERWVMWGCWSVTAICLAAWAISSYLATPPASRLEAPDTDLEITGCTPGQKRDVSLRLHNRSGRPLRVLGLTECWSSNCRFGPKRTDPELTELPPGPVEIVWELEVREPGEFSSQVHLFVDDGGAREIVFQIRGTAVASAATKQTEPR